MLIKLMEAEDLTTLVGLGATAGAGDAAAGDAAAGVGDGDGDGADSPGLVPLARVL